MTDLTEYLINIKYFLLSIYKEVNTWIQNSSTAVLKIITITIRFAQTKRCNKSKTKHTLLTHNLILNLEV